MANEPPQSFMGKISKGHQPFLHRLTAAGWGSPPAGAAGDADLKNLFKTCRDYHGDMEEGVQLLSFLNACAAYMLLTPLSRPVLNSLAGLRPGAQIVGDGAALVNAMAVLKAEAKEVDMATEKQCQAYEEAVAKVEKLRARLDMGHTTQREDERSDARVVMKIASSDYVKARHNAFLNYSARKLCVRGEPEGHLTRNAALTVKSSTGVDAWVSFSLQVYAMQCKGEENGKGAAARARTRPFNPSTPGRRSASFMSGWAD